MSDNTSDSEQQQQMKEIWICADVWLGIFAFLCPFDVGLNVALVNHRFDRLVDVHFKSRKWSLGSMEIRRATDGSGAQITKYYGGKRPLPIPQGPMPGKVIGFECIWICYVDQTVIEFLQRICRLFGSSGTNVAIHTFLCHGHSWEIIWQKIWPLVNDNICQLFLPYSYLDRLRQFSPAILRNCAKLRLIDSIEHFPDFPAEDNANASSSQAMAKWLLTPREDGRPKMLNCDFYSGMGIKRSFVNASAPVNFIICVCSFSRTEPFELTNNWTGERLTFRRLERDKWLLVRCPIVREEAKWAVWEKEAIEWKGHRLWNWNRIAINFADKDIGDEPVDAKAGPSELKNTSTARRPVVTKGNRDNVATAAARGTISKRSVVGISVVRNGPTKKQKQQQQEDEK